MQASEMQFCLQFRGIFQERDFANMQLTILYRQRGEQEGEQSHVVR